MAQKAVRHFFFLFLVAFSSIFSWPSFGQDQRTVYNNFIVVSPSDGNDSKTCLNGTRLAHVPCKTLDYVFEWISNEQHGNSTEVILEPGAYNLTKNATFQGVFDLGISGNGSNLDVEVFCFPDIGLTFIRSGNIQLQNVTISGCGALHHSTIGSAFERQHESHAMFYSGVFLAYCKEITIQNCRISHSPGIGLILYDVGGKVHISKSQFVQNAPTMNISYAKKHNYGLAGGGVYMEFTFDGALPPFDANDPERFAYQRDNHYLFEDCTFEGNQAPKQYFNGTLIEFPEGTDHMPFGRGGGLSVFVKGNATNNTVTVQGCQFSNNKALWGAGLFVEFQDKTEDNHLNIWNSHFTNNTASNGGGGVRSGILIWKGHFVANTITHRYNTYESNEAIFGGGVSHYGPSYSPVKDEYHIRELRFEGCTWKDNRATLGAALGLSTGLLDLPLKNLKLNPTFHYKVVLENATISGSRIIRTEDKKVVGQGAVYSCGIPIEFQGNTLFEKNSDTALVLDNALMKVYDTLTFTNNTGLLGGAVGVYGLSVIDLMPRSRLHFTHNHATEKGGAIYVAANGPPVLAFETTEFDIRNCFIGYNGSDSVESVDNWKVKIVFDSNTAKKGGGNSIFVHSLQSCRKPGQNRTNNETMQWRFITYRSAQGGNVSIGDEISTDPLQIVTNPEEWKVAPGEFFNATIELYDEKDSLVQGIVRLSLASQVQGTELRIPSPLLLIDPKNDTSKISNLMLKGSCRCPFDMTFTTLSGQTVITKLTDLMLTDCYLGFNLDPDKLECTCLTKESAGVSRCSEGKHVYLKTGYWGGIVDNKFTSYPCPQGYCSKTVTALNKKGEFQLNSETRCAKKRNQSSTLCGECQKNCSVLIGSEECGDAQDGCSYDTLYWFVPVFCILSAMFVCAVLALDLDIFTVYLNAWLYSYQIIPYLVNEDNQTLHEKDRFLPFLIGLANWRIHITKVTTCIPGLTGLYKLAIEYSFPLYVFLVLIVLRFSKINNDNTTHALCNLIILCYTDVILTSFKIIHYVHLNGKWVLFFDGSIDFAQNRGTHLPFTIIASILIIIALILAICLLIVPQVCHKRFPGYQSVRLFFDLFQSCFEDKENSQRNHRWFAGFYFLCRFAILLLAFYVPFGPLRRSVLEASCVVIAGVCLYFQPYNSKYWWMNIVDSILLVNLCLIAIFSTAITHDYEHRSGLRVVVHVFAYIPFVYLVLLFCVACLECWARIGEFRHQRLQNESTDEPSRSPVGSSDGARQNQSPVST